MSVTFASSSSTTDSFDITPTSFTRSSPPLRTPNPASGDGRSNGGSVPGSSLASAALYLYTFLATLLLLLAISSAIVIRSVFLRRRRRRIIQEAIQNGVLPPGELAHLARWGIGTQFGAGDVLARTKEFGKKPIMWEVYLHAVEEKASARAEETKGGTMINSAWKSERGTHWDDILPLHAAPVEEDKKDGNTNEGSVQDSPTQEQGFTVWGRRRRRRRRTVQAQDPAPPAASLSALVRRITASRTSMSNPPLSRGPESSGGTESSSAGASSGDRGIGTVNTEVDVPLIKQGTLLEMEVSKATPVTVAMLIAMPWPPPPSVSCDPSAYHVPKTSDNTSSTTMLSHAPTTPPSTRTTRISNSSNAGQTQTEQGGGEKSFPYLELGVAEVVVLPLSESDHVGEEGDRDMEEREQDVRDLGTGKGS